MKFFLECGTLSGREELLWDKKSANKKIAEGPRQRYIFMLNHGSL